MTTLLILRHSKEEPDGKGLGGEGKLLILRWPECRKGETLSCKERYNPKDLYPSASSNLLAFSPPSNSAIDWETSFQCM